MSEPSREAVERAKQEVFRLCQDGNNWRMSIPVNEALDSDRIIMAGLRALDAAQAAVWEAAAKEIPNNWLDPLLTGPDAVVPKECAAVDQYVIEKLLQALGKRLRARATAARPAGEEGR